MRSALCQNPQQTVGKSACRECQGTVSGVADDLIPEKISYYQVLKRLRSVVTQQGQIRDLLHILEEMEEELTHAG